MKGSDRFANLVEIMDRLRGEDGCPWDREQTYASLRGYVIEECYEVVDAIDRGDADALREELGDLLFQIVFLSRLAKEDGRFRAEDVVRGIAEKMIRRHPHVFGDDRAETSGDVLRKWEEIKRGEKAGPDAGRKSVLEGIPAALPALPKAQRLGTKAARVGLDWSDVDGVLAKLDEEIAELAAARKSADRAAVREEIGDILFTTAMLARKLDVDPEEALEAANRKFAERFRRVESALAERGAGIGAADAETLERLWEAAKPGGALKPPGNAPSA